MGERVKRDLAIVGQIVLFLLLLAGWLRAGDPPLYLLMLVHLVVLWVASRRVRQVEATLARALTLVEHRFAEPAASVAAEGRSRPPDSPPPRSAAP